MSCKHGINGWVLGKVGPNLKLERRRINHD